MYYEVSKMIFLWMILADDHQEVTENDNIHDGARRLQRRMAYLMVVTTRRLQRMPRKAKVISRRTQETTCNQ